MVATVDSLSSALELICASKKLERERGEQYIRSVPLPLAETTQLTEWIVEKLDGFTGWEDVYGGLTVGIILLQRLSEEDISQLGLLSKLEARVLACHENEEFRVRIAAGQLMGCLCSRAGLPLFRRFLPQVINGVVDNLERNPATNEEEVSMRELELAKERDTNLSRSSLSIFHDTAGWKHLETWMKCLQEMVVNLSPEQFIQIERRQILDLIFKAVQHTNRFVRETGFDVLTTMILGHGCYKDPNASEANFLTIASQIATGLSDNWSQVRMAASRAARTFFEVPPPPEHTVDEVYPILLPPMCLNRYYVAEGVRIYSQDTWCRVTKGEGKHLLGMHLGPALKYYIEQSDADNHAVREAACAAIAEAVSKLESELLRPHINVLLETLLTCFGDESWPVRDAACAALGTLVAQFPEDTRQAGYKDLFAEQFLRNLCDSIPSVRDVAAYSIARVLNSVSDPKLEKLYSDHIQKQLTELHNQPADSCGAESHRVQGKGPGASHVVTLKGEAAHDARHTNQTMYSCGSLAPKLQKGRKGGGCHDGLNQRPSEPWERADGAVRLIGQLGEHAPKLFNDNMIEQIVTAVGCTHYTHYPYFLETVCHVIAQLCNSLDKPRFKRHLDELLMVIAAAVQSQLPLAVIAGEETLKAISNRLGPNVFRGRVQGHFDLRVSRDLLQHLPQNF